MNKYEIFIALVAPRGINIDVISEQLSNAAQEYEYDVKKISLIDLTSSDNLLHTDVNRNDIDVQSERLQKLRKELHEQVENKTAVKPVSNDIHQLLSWLFIKKIQLARATSDKNIFYIIDHVTHPDELKALKQVYGDSLFTIGVTNSLQGRICDKKEQILSEEPKLKAPEALSKSVTDIVDDYLTEVRSNIDEFDYYNHVRGAYLQSDFFINLNSSELEKDRGGQTQSDSIKKTIERFVDLIFGAPNITPLKQEHSMFLAYTSALRSGDLSRQVGSTIVNDINDVVAMGANEVPKSGGGQYWADGSYVAHTEDNEKLFKSKEDQRDYALGHDTNVTVRESMAKELVALLHEKGLIISDKKSQVEETLLSSPLKDITEYGRVVHAEMSALMSAARNGTLVKGMHMFCTTYPCHNCAKHLVAAGIKKVYYIEPYPKSRAVDSHTDAIFDPESLNIDFDISASGDDSDSSYIQSLRDKVYQAFEEGTLINNKTTLAGKDKLIFEPFFGVGPRRYVDLFSMSMGSGRALKRKSGSKAILLDRTSNNEPRVPIKSNQNEFYEQEYFTNLNNRLDTDINSLCDSAIKIFSDKHKSLSGDRLRSTVKFWHHKLSYGYIICPNGGDDFPFNRQNIEDDQYTPSDGDKVSFQSLKGNKKIFADKIIQE
ncbi:deaminase [Pseudoalteromonas luteoviolacea]|uniref:CMP/dCMP-type deaminase domain-containing protein n=1 Tax=Pseudoalteromonas luteoviolacea NCIMB 1942 TaxID=1365253 RepID=A0A166Z2P2_9GAMM|nr:deaminase [Pseudoalteromonas luteoviolacea]KZN43766.1 hypothetical protein N482_18765 [Pseudoalteromonas luteoviolacea NCIMB 1942]